MPRRSRFSLVEDEILAHFARQARRVYSKSQLADLLAQKADDWDLYDAKTNDFVSYLIKHGNLRIFKLRAEKYQKEITRYCWGRPSTLALAASIHPRAYLTHGTAMVLHKLIPKSNIKALYVNIEQSEKHSSRGPLTQEGINRAFSASQRQSTLVYNCNRSPLVVLAGKHTGQLAVETLAPDAIPVTNLERTLIDIAVRPSYAGSLSNVLRAYQSAKDRVAVDKLLKILNDLDYLYPYHQSIGFLMERTGYPTESLRKMRTLGLEYDFYLAHRLRTRIYSKEWRLFYPADLA